jgi:hypothetical protein
VGPKTVRNRVVTLRLGLQLDVCVFASIADVRP